MVITMVVSIARHAQTIADPTSDRQRVLGAPLTAEGRFGKQDFAYLPDADAYRCPAGEKLTYRYSNEEKGQPLRRYW